MFKKILIANRGEIACRIIRTARAMGIQTVAVHSDIDRNAQHVQLADEAISLGGMTAQESYLQADKIIAACQQTGAEAVHPGYGFLSEQAAFATALGQNNIAFIGPPANAIAAMGDKIESKKLAKAAGVSTVPGHVGVIETAAEAVKIANDIGYPVMIKASAGGGGKGMRIAHSAEDVETGYATAMREAASSFGDDRVFIEKFITSPRHIEIQILADQHGNCIHLNERECSIQRRNQKVIEEAPSPFLDETTRQAMGEEAIRLAMAVDYHSAGTVEFIVDADRNFYFLEMNTRLQVEHPVTELITGLDLVEEMIRVAAGETLRHQQSDIGINGWAMESRLYAEDPYRNFMPAIGRLSLYRPPEEKHHDDGSLTRNDTGVAEGDTISIYYDPMIAKLCSWAVDRSAAIGRMRVALDDFVMRGIGHNIPFLSAVMEHQRFLSGDISTAFIDEEYKDGFQGVAPSPDRMRDLGLIIAAAAHKDAQRQSSSPGQDWAIQFVTDDPAQMADANLRCSFHLCQQDTALTADISPYADTAAGTTDAISIEIHQSADTPRVAASITDHKDDKTRHYICQLHKNKDSWQIYYRGTHLAAHARPPHIASLAHYMKPVIAPDRSNMLLCPMPGNLVKIMVADGDVVEAGQTLCIVEAMKMENALVAEKRCRIDSIEAKAGDILSVDAVIMRFADANA
ncbi:MAG: acetyl/propionyl/methylcrotonyl-CoA carboxylase subunit alpha [Proteobacteria bacterium]|nr:acetyl/propionyl/methylcrotonyl-CoA carboxylase subunit alpha [Pseudomonadota bacterium]MDA0844786.1 acetyl/propionyl/methylcrotonyl-CoA carboxylase subunit alpha [Pseudomonadota bacterium]